MFKLIEDSDVRSLRSLPLHLYNLNFLFDKSKIQFDKKLSPLLVATFLGKIEVIHLLLSNECLNINLASENEGYTPLMVALYNGHYEVTKLLLDKGADINIITKSGHYPILFCFSRLEEENYKYENMTLCMLLIELMLVKGADLNKRVDNNIGYSILMKLLSVEINEEESFQTTFKIIKFLMERGADKSVTTFNNQSVYDVIKEGKYKGELMELIKNTTQIYFFENYKNSNNKNTNYNKSLESSNQILLEDSSIRTNCCIIF